MTMQNTILDMQESEIPLMDSLGIVLLLDLNKEISIVSVVGWTSQFIYISTVRI